MIGGRPFDFSRQIIVMGIVNRTPDSFFDQGRTYGLDEAVTAALAAEEAGAGWVDIGGVPFSPDIPEVDEAEEIDRVLPVVAAVSAGQASVVITHSKAQPRQHFPRPHYDDLLSEIKNFLRERVQRAVDAGVPENKIILDAGHDLNKNTFHSLELTRRLAEIADIGLPLLAAVSNKDFVGEATGLSKADRLAPTLAAATACMLSGARILRMHDVAHAVAAAHMVEAILGFRRPASPRHNL